MRIQSISYLRSDERKHTRCTRGKFTIVEVRVLDGRIRRTPSKYTAIQFVTHPYVVDNDPVLTLKDGTKMRVYQSGDPSQMVVQAHSLIEIHDNECAPDPNRETLDYPMDDMFEYPDFDDP